MNVRQAALRALAATRGIAPAMGFHVVSVVLRTATWAGNIETGPMTVADLVIGHPHPVTGVILPPHVKGAPTDPVLKVGPLTPFDPVAAPRGFTLAQLNPGDAQKTEYYFRITWPGGLIKRYQLEARGLDATRPLHVILTLEAVDLDFTF